MKAVTYQSHLSYCHLACHFATQPVQANYGGKTWSKKLDLQTLRCHIGGVGKLLPPLSKQLPTLLLRHCIFFFLQ